MRDSKRFADWPTYWRWLCVTALILTLSCGKTSQDEHAIHRHPVSSTALRSVGYDKTNEVLEIEFQNGAIYRYFNVPQRTYDDLLAAESHGRFFVRHIRNAGFRYTRINGRIKRSSAR